MSPKFGTTAKVWATGSWTSALLDVSVLGHADSNNNVWSKVEWKESDTADSSVAYVTLDILDSDGAVLQGNLSGIALGHGVKRIDLSSYANVKAVDIFLKFKVYGKSKTPIVSQIEVS